MTDEQALEVLGLIDCHGLAKTARDISVARIKGLMELPNEVRELKANGGKFYKQGFETCQMKVLKLIAKHRKEQNW